jgi:chemotaxis protein methyltransferase WspC
VHVLEERLRSAAGLDLSGCCPNVVRLAVQRRCTALGNLPAEDYLARVAAGDDELWKLVEEVVVPETWFFREPEAFAALARMAVQGAAAGTVPFRVLSLPCATGEEPYSAVMTLLAAGLPLSAFSVEAADLSARLLEHAAAGEYDRHSFRGGSAKAWNRFFQSDGDTRRLTLEVRNAVRFRQANVLRPDQFRGAGPYDFIFCRNLLIYLSPDAQRQVLDQVCAMLKPEGCLVGAIAESRALLRHGLSSRTVAGCYVFQIAETGSRAASMARRRLSRLPAGPPAPPAEPRPPAAGPQSQPPATPAPSDLPSPAGRDSREEMLLAMSLADQGRLAEAAEVCERHLQRSPPTARAYYLLGLVRDAAGQSELATELYRKALYLDPHHEEALVHLALLLERAGDAEGGRVLRERARRARRLEGLSP